MLQPGLSVGEAQRWKVVLLSWRVTPRIAGSDDVDAVGWKEPAFHFKLGLREKVVRKSRETGVWMPVPPAVPSR